MEAIRSTLAVRRALLATCNQGPSDPALLRDAAVAVDDRLVVWIGPDAALEDAVDLSGARQIDAAGRLVTPGLVDAHTHLVFADSPRRESEFAERCRGRTYLEAARDGGGIAATVAATRAAGDGELLASALTRARRLLAHGVTTVEVKSGYGLSVDQELRILRIVRELARSLSGQMTVAPTLLAAHAVPAERAGDREGWVRAICQEIVPAVARQRLALFCDAFAEEGAFTIDEARRVLQAGAAHGLVPRLHADQLGAGGGARLAAELGCASADHLDHVDDEGIAALARAGVTACLLPTSTLFAGGGRHAPGRRLLDAGVPVALATNVNPGTAPSENAALTLSLACLRLGLTPGEALVAFTAGGARALRLDDAGRIARGLEADLVLWGCRSVEHLPWHMGVPHALLVVKRGRIVHQADPRSAADCGVG